ncbi:actin-binding WH2 domain-containing protein [Leptolyngbya sp. FACHB-671]|uniref:actin-binding WH2 domain-containing protein n=1 Tax=Leptolyngbya sp. FACHB-671 TaxID=2692812 RepID=UPI001F54D647|nr:actin-binding WH2 domain-containing protein [Leptolyngbya sp. FACHB-671]
MNYFALLMHFLRDRQTFLDEVYKGIKINQKVFSMLVCSTVFLAFYGIIIGLSSSWEQAIASAIKLPALYLITLLICLPTLYFFDVISGSTRTFGQYLALLLASTSVISVMLCAFAPIALFFHLSINDYVFFKLVNVLIFAFTGFLGINFFYKGMMAIASCDPETSPHQPSIMRGWLILYGFVGSQLGWSLRPFLAHPTNPSRYFESKKVTFISMSSKCLVRCWGLVRCYTNRLCSE